MTCGNDAEVLAEERKGLCEHVRRLEKPKACLEWTMGSGATAASFGKAKVHVFIAVKHCSL